MASPLKPHPTTIHCDLDPESDMQGISLASSHSNGHLGDHKNQVVPTGQVERDPRVRRIVRRIDWRMLPLLGILSALSLVDRSNLGLARTAGMDDDLHLRVGSRYSIVSCIFFVPYVLFQLPSNLFLRKLGAARYLAFLVVAWGAVQLAMGFVPSWGYLGLCRALLDCGPRISSQFFLDAVRIHNDGIYRSSTSHFPGGFIWNCVFAGFFPAMVFIITTWYTRHEVQTRLAAFYVIGVFVGGFSAIFAYVLTLLGGRHGITGWAWIFIVEGAITLGFGIIAWFYLPNFPDQKNVFLSEEDTKLILDRVEKDRGDSIPDLLTTQKVVDHLLDWKIWATGIMYMCATMPAYAISLFVTMILFGMGWNIADSLLLSAPPYIFAAVSIVFFAWVSDKYRQRAAVIAVQSCITLIGLLMTGFAPQLGVRYAGLFLTTAGSGGCIPGILAYASNNVVSHTKRAVTTAVVVSFSGIGGIFASLVFRQVDAPRYLPGIYAIMGCQFLLLVLLAVTTTYFFLKNKAAQKGVILEGHPGFLYTL